MQSVTWANNLKTVLSISQLINNLLLITSPAAIWAKTTCTDGLKNVSGAHSHCASFLYKYIYKDAHIVYASGPWSDTRPKTSWTQEIKKIQAGGRICTEKYTATHFQQVRWWLRQITTVWVYTLFSRTILHSLPSVDLFPFLYMTEW